MHHDFKGTAGKGVEYLFFIDNNKFPVLFKCILNQKVVSNRCYSDNPFLSYSKKTSWKNLTTKQESTSHGVISKKFNNDSFGSQMLTVYRIWLQDKRMLRSSTMLKIRKILQKEGLK